MNNDDKPDPLLEEAIDWLLLLQEAPTDVELRRQQQMWLSQSSFHVTAWEKACHTWQAMGNVTPVYAHVWKPDQTGISPVVQDRRVARPRETGNRNWRAASVAATLALAAVFVFAFMPSLMLYFQADYQTATGEIQTIQLEDGSVVTLGAHSALAKNLSGDGRRVELLAGQAFFEIHRDEARPFIVSASGVEVKVLGTAFDVRLSSGSRTVQLQHGVVQVKLDGETPPADQLSTPGDSVVVDMAMGSMARSVVSPESVGSWRNGKLFVQDATIGEVVEQLQRYQRGWILIPDGVLASQRVTGLYDLSNPDRALHALVQPYGGRVHQLSPYLIIAARF